MKHLALLISFTIALVASSAIVQAEPGHPVAVRWWGQAMVSIETYWNQTIVIDPYSEKIGYENPNLSADLVLVTHEHEDHNNADLISGKPHVERGHDAEGKARSFSMVLDRFPGQDKSRWYDARQRIARSPNAIKVTSIPAWHVKTQDLQSGANTLFLIEVDSVRIAHCGDLGQPKLTETQLTALGKVDVLFLPVGGVHIVGGAEAAEIVEQVKPHIVIPIHYKTPNLVYDAQSVQGFLDAVGDRRELVRAKGNTLAVSTANDETAKPQTVVLNFLPHQLPKEWEDLYTAKEKSCRASQQVFAKLSADQLNFKPSNGTHTPRWNVEHMMGRELGFFTQIFAKVDPAIKPLNLNPKQMPPDYVAAHPTWDGKEEARQMERVTALTRRFAYLIDELPLDEKAPGSFWTPRKLLKQMERHYSEHTANVKKKFELPDWPSE